MDQKPPDEHADAFAKSEPRVLARRLFTEGIGTFLLVTVDCGGAMIAAMSEQVSPAARSAATGLVVMAMIYTMGDVSGAHFNPAVTTAFALRRVFPWRHVPLYWMGQLAGAVVASILLRLVFGNIEHLGTTIPHYGDMPAFVMETFLTMLVVMVTLGTATRHRVLGANAAIAAGGTIALCSLFSRPISGASMNPARSLSPALISNSIEHLWIYLSAPFLGAILGTLIMSIIHLRKHASEKEAAEGETK